MPRARARTASKSAYLSRARNPAPERAFDSRSSDCLDTPPCPAGSCTGSRVPASTSAPTRRTEIPSRSAASIWLAHSSLGTIRTERRIGSGYPFACRSSIRRRRRSLDPVTCPTLPGVTAARVADRGSYARASRRSCNHAVRGAAVLLVPPGWITDLQGGRNERCSVTYAELSTRRRNRQSLQWRRGGSGQEGGGI